MATPEMRELRPTGANIPSDSQLLARAVDEVQTLQAENERLHAVADAALRTLGVVSGLAHPVINELAEALAKLHDE